MDKNNRCITIVPSRVAWLLAGIAVFLVLASIATQVFKHATGHDVAYGLIRLFDLDEEQNIPTFFSSAILLFASALIGLIAALKRKASGPFASHWAGLAFVFLFFATDEAASIHELFGRPTREFVAGAAGLFYAAWVVPGIALVVVLAFAYLKFWRHLPLPTRRLVLDAGLIYCAGAIGLEIISGRYYGLHPTSEFTYSMIVTLEESLEMAGVILFILAVLGYMKNSFPEVQFRFRGNRMAGGQVREPGEHSGVRKYARFPVSVPVVGRAPQFSRDAITGMVRNVSCGGLMAEFAVPKVDCGPLALALQTRRGPLEVEGTVVWTSAFDSRIRCGIAFPEPKAQDFVVGLFAAGNQ